MRIALLTPFLSPRGGGLFSAARDLALALQERGEIELRIFGILDEGPSTDLSPWERLDVCAIDTIGPKSVGWAPKAIGAVAAFKPNVIHSHGLWTFQSIVSVLVSRKLSIPRIVSPHGMLDSWALEQSPIRKRIALATYEGLNLKSAARIHALSDAEADSIRQLGIAAPIAIVPNGVHAPNDGERVQRAVWMSRLSSDSRVLLFLGRIHRKKGLEALLTAWGRVSTQKHNRGVWQLVIAGWGEDDYRAMLEKLVREIGSSSNVHFVGPQLGEARDQSYASADAFVLPSLSEGLPMTVLEAWSRALPVLMTEACNIPEGFEYGAAIKIQPEPNSIEAQLISLFQSEDAVLKEMGRRGRVLVEARFTWEAAAREFAALYQELSEQSRRIH